MADTTVKIRLAAEDAASPKINQVKQSLSQMLSQTGAAGTMAGSLLAGGLTAGLTVAAQMAQGAAQAAWDLGVMGAQAQRTEASFAQMASSVGASGQAMLAAMRTATAGTVADTDLMLAANQAMMLGVSDNAEEMSQLMAAAIERGRALGVSSQQAVNDIITGIGRMSPMILDKLGIVGAQQSMEEYARALGVTADALTDVQKKQALVNAVIASSSGGPVLEDAASAFERMDASIAKMKGALGELFGPAIAAIAQQLADAVDGVNDALENEAMVNATNDAWALGASLDGMMQSYDAAVASMQTAITSGDGDGFTAASQHANELMQAMIALAEERNRVAAQFGSPLIDIDAIRRGELAFVDAAGAARGLGESGGVAAGGMSIAESQAQRLKAALAALEGQADNAGVALRGAFINAAAALGAAGALSGFKAKQQELNLLRQEWQYMGLTAEQVAFKESEFLGNTAEALRIQVSAMDDLNSSAGRAASGGVSALDSAMSDLQSRVQSMLSGALSPSDISVPGMPRSDDINENARRLAAIANEGIGDQSWMEEFKNEVPGIFDEIVSAANPQAAAARIFTEFQAGLRPELIDRNLVKERIKAMITGEQEMSALASEIAAELAAEMGVSLPEAMSAAQDALGVKPSGGDSAFGSGFEEGIDAQATAAGSLAKIAKAFLENEAQVRSSGAVVGAWWGEGFMAVVGQNVPPGLLDLLTNLLLPRIQAAAAATASQTGAP